MSTYEEEAKRILRDGSTSYWLKEAIRTLNASDVVDALNDVEVLSELLQLKMNEVME